MLDLQIDNITPFAAGKRSSTVLNRWMSWTARPARARVAIAREKATVNERVEALETAGTARAEIVSVDALAMFRALTKRNLLATDDKRNVLVMLGPTTADVIVYSRGVILAVRSIVLGADSESILREELQRTFVAAEAGQPQRARGIVTFLTRDEQAKGFADRVASGLDAGTSFLTNGAVPSPGLSLCLECAGTEAPPLNLLPDEWRQKRQTAAFRHHLIRGGIALAIVYALAVTVFLTFLVFRNSTPPPAGERDQEPTGRVPQGEGSCRASCWPCPSNSTWKSSALEVMLRQVAECFCPDNVKLTSFVYKKDQIGHHQGGTGSPTPTLALDFQSRLEKCDLFSKVVP